MIFIQRILNHDSSKMRASLLCQRSHRGLHPLKRNIFQNHLFAFEARINEQTRVLLSFQVVRYY